MPKDDPMRGTGRTTGLLLLAISEALLRPGKWVEFKDHAPMDTIRCNIFEMRLESISSQLLGLTMLTKICKGKVFIKSPILGIRRREKAKG